MVAEEPAPPVVVVLYRDQRPPGMAEVAANAELRYATAAELPQALRGAQSLFVWDFLSTAVPAAWPMADQLRWVHIASAGVDRLLFPELVHSPVLVTNSRGVFDRPIAEYVLGLVLLMAKDLVTTLELQGSGTWRHRETERVEGKQVLVFGVGSIGRCIGQLLRAVGMDVVGVGRTPRDGDPIFGRVHGSTELLELLPRADFVVSAAPLTSATRGVFDALAFRRMRPSARLINVGRGPLVVEEDLIVALQQGEIAGAALDVFVDEPLPPDHPLWRMPGVVVSPHMSGDCVGWLTELSALFTDNFRRWRAGQPLRNVVDKSAGYVPTS